KLEYIVMRSITTNKIWALAWPMILSNISVPLLGLVDTAVLGHLASANYLAAVAVGSAIIAFLYWGFGFLRMGTTGETAKAFGRHCGNESVLILLRAAAIALVISAIIAVFHPWLFRFGLWAMNSEANVSALADQYLNIRLYSAPAAMVNYVLIGWFIGMQRPKLALLSVIFCNVVNIALDLVFVVGLEMTSAGVAWATVIAEYASCLFGAWLAKPHIGAAINRATLRQLRQWQAWFALIKGNSFLFVRTVTLLLTMAAFTRRGGEFGTLVLAANALLMQLAMLVSYGLDGFANAAEALVGEAIGRKDNQQLRHAMMGTADFSAVVALLFTAFLWLGHEPMINALTTQTGIRAIATEYVSYVIAFPCIAVWCFWLDGVFIGANRHLPMMWSMLFSAVVVFGGLLIVLSDWQNHGLWTAYLTFMAARGLSLGFISYRYSKRESWFQSS
ncbi:MAG: hypothetical protein RL336_2028, partial [Pseudomonadota bacterium]